MRTRQLAFSILAPRKFAPGSMAPGVRLGMVTVINEKRHECTIAMQSRNNQYAGGFLYQVPYPRGVDIRPADEVAVAFGNEDTRNARVIAVYSQRNAELSPELNGQGKHYVVDVEDAEYEEAVGKRVREFVHEYLQRDDREDPFTIKRATWIRILKTGQVDFVHNEDYEDATALEEKDLLRLRIGADRKVEVFLAEAGFRLVRKGLEVSIGEDGIFVKAPEDAVTIMAKSATISADGDASVTAKGTARVSGAEVTVEAPSVSVVSEGQVKIQAPQVQIGPGGDGKRVLVEGARVLPHEHTVEVDGETYTTSSVDLTVEEAGQGGVTVG